jgi:hypothetical protein
MTPADHEALVKRLHEAKQLAVDLRENWQGLTRGVMTRDQILQIAEHLEASGEAATAIESLAAAPPPTSQWQEVLSALRIAQSWMPTIPLTAEAAEEVGTVKGVIARLEVGVLPTPPTEQDKP